MMAKELAMIRRVKKGSSEGNLQFQIDIIDNDLGTWKFALVPHIRQNSIWIRATAGQFTRHFAN
jgi:hypothetical protein